jgi:hypothetical protein
LKLQLVDVATIAPREQQRAQPVPALVDSIRRHGVLQPLLVDVQNGRVRLLAGDRRLVAAAAVGLRQVPCIVRHGGDEAEVFAASNIFAATASRPSGEPEPDVASADAAAELDRSLAALAACPDLFGGPVSELAKRMTANLLRAEVWRTTWLVRAAAVLRGEISVTRGRIAVETLVGRVLQSVEAERCLRSVVLRRQLTLSHSHIVGDEDLLVCALSGVLMTTMRLIEGVSTSVSVIARLNPAGEFIFSVTQDGVSPPSAWSEPVPREPGFDRTDGFGAVALATARRIVETHHGRLTVNGGECDSEIHLAIPGVSSRE